MMLACGFLLILPLLQSATAQFANATTKRGIAYLGTKHSSDYNIFVSRSSPISWYYNWSPWPVSQPSRFSDIEFVPLLHNLDSLEADLAQIDRLPPSSTHLLTFNEPDHVAEGGGTDISPEDAARAYVEQINPLSVQSGNKWHVSHPSTTGTLSGLNWLQRFNTSCYEIAPETGCLIDFVATHFYGDFPALASWLGTLNEYYNTNTSSNLGVWITELALPQQDAEATEIMMNTTLPFLDASEYVERYSWFGIFRRENANEWTGDGVALLDNSGDLTELGATYLGGEADGFKEGMSADDGNVGNGAATVGVSRNIVFSLALLSILFWMS